MKICVCIKQVPDTSEVELDPQTNTLIRKGLPSIINPDDKAGITAALALKNQVKNGSITVISMGPPQAEMALKEALAMGCDDAVLISAKEFSGSDTLATSTILAAALKKIGFDLIITGRQAIDGDTAQVGPQIAEHLGIPQVSYAVSYEVQGDSLIVLRQFEDRYYKLMVKLPCLLTTLSKATEIDYMTVSGIIEGENKELTLMDYNALRDMLAPDSIGLKGSPTNVCKAYTKEAKGQGAILKDLSPRQAAQAIVDRIREAHIL